MVQGKELIRQLAEQYKKHTMADHLKIASMAQWLLESGRGSSKLSYLFLNFGGIKYRKDMAPYAVSIQYEANDGVDVYCRFINLEAFILGYWAFINRDPYKGWKLRSRTAEEFIDFIGPTYSGSKAYPAKVKALMPEAASLLGLKYTSTSTPPTKDIRMQTWIPFARKHAQSMKTRGHYQYGYPKGAIVHYTAGHFEKGMYSAIQTISGGVKDKFAYLCIPRFADPGDQMLVQAHPIDEWGYHAGESRWKNLLGGVSDDLIGIEMCNAGKLEKTKDGRFQTWFKTYIPEADVRYVTQEQWGCPTGYYHKYSFEQEESLIRTLLWLKQNDPANIFSFDFVLGHHEVAGLLGIGKWRKADPGGALSMPMPQFRDLLRDRWNQIKSNRFEEFTQPTFG